MSYRVRFTMPDGRTGLWMRDYATREEAQQAIDDRMADTGLLYYVEEVATPEARIRELEAEIAQLRDAYDAARQDLDVAKRNAARLESTLSMVQASWAVSVVRLDRALALGDAMHRAHPSEEWAAYKDTLAALRQGPAKASEAPGEGGDIGEGAK